MIQSFHCSTGQYVLQRERQERVASSDKLSQPAIGDDLKKEIINHAK